MLIEEHQNFRRQYDDIQHQNKLLRIDMIIRGCLRVQLPRVAAKRTFRTFAQPTRVARRYSTANAPPMASSVPQSQASMLATITTDLDRIAPRFEMQPDQITVIQTPAEFYETLKVG